MTALLRSISFLVLATLPFSAFAQEAGPGTPCQVAETGHYRLSGGAANGGEGHLLSCNGTEWVRIYSFNNDGVFRPGVVNPGDCTDGQPLVFHAASGGMACGDATVIPPFVEPPLGCGWGSLVWTVETPPNGNDYRGIAYGNGVFVATSHDGQFVGNNQNIATSSDGVTWTPHDMATGLSAVAFGNNRFVALQAFNGGRIAVVSNSDATEWTAYADALPASGNWETLAYGPAGFIAVNSNGTTSRIAISEDGISWTDVNINAQVPGGQWMNIIYANGRYVATRGWTWNESGQPAIMSSPDGLNWTGHTDANGCPIIEIVYGGGQFVSPGCWSTPLVRSSDGDNWTLGGHSGETPDLIKNLAYESSIGFVGTGGGWPNNGYIYYSANGTAWSRMAGPAGWGGGFDGHSFTYGNASFVGVSTNAFLHGTCPG